MRASAKASALRVSPSLRSGHITECIWLRYASPKSCFAGLQIRSKRYPRENLKIFTSEERYGSIILDSRA
jgi:hypothetical protein